MYQIISSDGSVLYDVSYPDTYMVTEPKATLEIGQPGSLQFSLVPEHPKYSQVEVMKTYVTATKEGSEIFYGRIIDINVDQTTGVKEIECAGALQFLEDGEIPPVQNQNAGEGEDKGVTMTASAFFTMCINSFNSDIGNDSKRNLYVGTISHSKASETKVYNIGSYTQVKSALDSNIISEYGGYFKIRKSGNAHYVDWLESYSEPNSSPIRLTENVVSQQNAISANEFFTLIRPIGKDSLTLPEVTIPVSSALVSEYGRIIRTEQFGDAETESDLRSKTNQYISRIGKGLGRTCTVKVVDMHFLKNTVTAIHLGSTYTNISGFEGEEMVVAGMELNFANPAEDSVTLKNSKELCQIQMGGSTGRGTLSQASRAGSGSGKGGFQNIWEHITETEDTLSLHAKEISINAEHLIETANEFERYSRRTDDAINKIEGTGVFQNNDRITQIAGSFSTRYFVVPQAKRDAPGANPSAYHWYVCSPYQVIEDDIGSGKEFFQTPNAALTGDALNTAALTVGQTVYRMHYTDDITPVSTTVYYTKGLSLGGGTELTLTEDGMEVTVASAILSNQDDIVTIEGSALWTQRNNITGVVGEFEIRTDPVTGERRVVVKSGGGMTILKNNVEYGLYDEYNLTGGLIVDKLNEDGTVHTQIKGDIIDITTNTQYGQIAQTVGSHTTTINNQGQVINQITGSTIWQNRNQITGFVGEFEFVGEGDNRRLKIKNGGGIIVKRNNTEFGLYDSGNLSGGVLVEKINDGSVTTKISGNRVDITASQVKIGSTTNVQNWMNSTDTWKNSTDETLDTYQGLIADRATIAQLNAQKARIDTLEADSITTSWLQSHDIVTNDIDCSDIFGNTCDMNSISTASIELNGHTFGDCLVGASVNSNTNTLTLTYASGGTVTFSKPAPVITLSPSWSGRTFTVTVVKDGTATSTKTSVDVYARLHAVDGNHMDVAAATYANGVYTVHGSATDLYVVQNGSGSSAKAQIRTGNGASSGTAYASLNIGGLYTAGVNDAKPVSGTAGGRTSGTTALVHDFTITKGDGTTATLQINVSNIYTAARSGYTLGTFTLASVTTQGSRNDNVYVVSTASDATTYYTPGTAANYYKEVSSGGTVYYTAGSAVTKLGSSESVYASSTSGVTYYRAGTAVTKIGTQHNMRYMQIYNASGTSLGYHYVSTGNGVAEASINWYAAGDSVTPISSTSIKVASTTRYTSGGSVTPVSSTSIRVAARASVTPITSTSLKLKKSTYYAAGTTVTNTYYTKS